MISTSFKPITNYLKILLILIRMAGKKESFLLVSLNEDKAKELAQVVSNDTCRRILDYLSEKEATESEIAKELKVPISTVHYNLQHLIKGRLVVVEEFHYSEKGKEVNHYKIANKYIIIAPKTTWGLKERLRKILPIAAVTVVGAFAIEIARRLFTTVSSGFTRSSETFEASGVAEKAVEATPEAIMTAVDEAGAPVADAAMGALDQAVEPATEVIKVTVRETITTSSPIWQHAAIWVLIGGFLAILTYLFVDWIKKK